MPSRISLLRNCACLLSLLLLPQLAVAQVWSVLSDRVEIGDEARFSVSQTDLELEEILRLLINDSGLSLVIEGTLPLTTPIRIFDATIGEALESLARAHDFTYTVEGSALIVSAIETRNFRIDYLGDPEASFWSDLTLSLTAILGEDARFAVSPRSGGVTVIAAPSRVREVDRHLNALEATLAEQVHIEAKIVEISLDETLQLGVDWTIFEDGWDNIEPNTDAGGLVQLRSTEDIGGLFQMGLLRTDKLDILIEALESEGNLEIISRPRVAAMGNEPAVFRMTENVPFYEIEVITTEGSQPYIQYDVDFKEAGVTLEVFAQIGDDGTVTLKVHPNVSTVTGFTTSLPNLPPQPIIDRRETETSVRLREGQTLVIGGMIQTLETERTTGIPFLSRLPFLGGAFRRSKTEQQRRELVVLLTPHIMHDDVVKTLRESGHGLRLTPSWRPETPRASFAAHEHNRAIDAFDSGDVHEAVTRSQRAVAFAPESVEARMNLGYFLAQSGRISDARVQWKKLAGSQGRAVPWARTNLLALDAATRNPSNRLTGILDQSDSSLIRAAALVNEAIRDAEMGQSGSAQILIDQARSEVEREDLRNMLEEIEQSWGRPAEDTFNGWSSAEAAARD